tara:strand:+ start:1134 stop:1601 length:468 start_codon:yes stop_codon:yes gene_type:complete
VSFSESTYFVDFSKILNTSSAGLSAQKSLKKMIKTESEEFKKKEIELRKEEAEIISQKKTLDKDEYSKKVEVLRKKFSDFQVSKKKMLSKFTKSRSDARESLLKAINPILKKYMEDNNIRLIIDKKSVLMGDTTLEITKQIIDILNKKITTLKIN